MEIQTKNYTMQYDRATQTVTCSGAFRLSQVEEYAPIVDLLNEVADSSPNTVTLDLRKLEFLNSSGINIFSKFVIKVRQQKNIQIAIKGSKQIPWQIKSLKNLQRLMPSLHLELE
ncbi:slr1659 superfamily regulator [Microcoleus sp. B9-D4]|uniref:slr1659 superfamily regulator n=1 Tax=Microcoleus sp. B9-D4 TaxID=2818711 RepID=UPI002FD2A1C1